MKIWCIFLKFRVNALAPVTRFNICFDVCLYANASKICRRQRELFPISHDGFANFYFVCHCRLPRECLWFSSLCLSSTSSLLQITFSCLMEPSFCRLLTVVVVVQNGEVSCITSPLASHVNWIDIIYQVFVYVLEFIMRIITSRNALFDLFHSLNCFTFFTWRI